jgi:hypothetical protein
MDYDAATHYIKDAYERVLAAASSINVIVEPEARPADYKSHGKSFMFVDSTDSWRRLGLR